MSAFDLPASPLRNPLQLLSRLLFEAENTSSKIEKQDIVAKYAVSVDSGVSGLLNRALSPMITYGVRQIHSDFRSFAPPSADFDNYAVGLRLLARLSRRELSGTAALEGIHAYMALLDPVAEEGAVSLRETFRRVLMKDLKAGFGDSTVNRAVKGLIPTFPYMRCSLIKDVKLDVWEKEGVWKVGAISQEKADGMFANLDVEVGGGVQLSSRQGSLFPMVPFVTIVTEARGRLRAGMQYHGELLVRRDGVILPREQSNGILNSALQGGQFGAGEVPVYMAWDMIPLESIKPKGKFEVPYASRVEDLLIAINTGATPRSTISMIDTRIVYSMDEAYAHYRELLAKGKEGTILKHPKAIWRDGTSKEQVKLKLEVDVELRVVGFVAGEGKNAATFGSLLCQTSDGLLEVAVSGFTDAKRAEIHTNREFTIGSIVTVRANSIMLPSSSSSVHSLFLPRFVEFRSDKAEADSLQRVSDQFASAIK